MKRFLILFFFSLGIFSAALAFLSPIVYADTTLISNTPAISQTSGDNTNANQDMQSLGTGLSGTVTNITVKMYKIGNSGAGTPTAKIRLICYTDSSYSSSCGTSSWSNTQNITNYSSPMVEYTFTGLNYYLSSLYYYKINAETVTNNNTHAVFGFSSFTNPYANGECLAPSNGSCTVGNYLNSNAADMYMIIYIKSVSLSISDVTMDSASSSATMTISGDTSYTQAGEICDVSFSLQNSITNEILAPEFATYHLVADTGEYGFTTTNSTFTIPGVVVPYFAGKSTQIAEKIQCYHEENGEFFIDVNKQGTSYYDQLIPYSPDLIATSSAFINTEDYGSTCTSDNLIGQAMCDFRQWLYTTFIGVVTTLLMC